VVAKPADRRRGWTAAQARLHGCSCCRWPELRRLWAGGFRGKFFV